MNEGYMTYEHRIRVILLLEVKGSEITHSPISILSIEEHGRE